MACAVADLLPHIAEHDPWHPWRSTRQETDLVGVGHSVQVGADDQREVTDWVATPLAAELEQPLDLQLSGRRRVETMVDVS